MTERNPLLLRRSDAPGFDAVLRQLGLEYDCRVAATLEETRGILAQHPVAVAIVWDLPDAEDGLTYCRALRLAHPELKIILMAGGADQSRVIEAFNHGYLFRCLTEPVSPEALDDAIRAAIRQSEMDRVQSLLIQNAAQIDRQVLSTPYWLYRLQTSTSTFVRALAGSVGVCAVTVLVVLLAGIGVFLLLYYVKSALGIDLFGDKHLKDFLP